MQIHFTEPLWLLLSVAPLLTQLSGVSRHGRATRLARFADARLLPWLLSGLPGARRGGKVFLLAWVLGCIALSAPYLRATPSAELRHALDIAVVLDISPSMQAQDITPSRLQRAKWELEDFLRLSPADRRALVVFSANAYVVLPLTPDREVLRHFLAAIDTGVAARRGSSLGLAIERAAALLADSRRGSRAMVLISDGESHDGGALHAAREAGLAGIPLLILGVGTEQGAPVPDAAGAFERDGSAPVISRLARSELQTMAEASGGAYTDLRADDSDWSRLTAKLDALARSNPYQHTSGEVVPLFPWLVAASVGLFLWWGRPAMLLTCVVIVPFTAGLMPSTVQASPWQEQQALEALQRNDLATAAELYGTSDHFNAQLGRGVIAYRRGDFRGALSAFESALARARNDRQRARAHYNAGNALARLGRLSDAAQHYRAALTFQPNYPRASLNLNLVNEQQHLQWQRNRSGEQLASPSRPSREGEFQPDGFSASADTPAAAPPSQTPGGVTPPQTNSATKTTMGDAAGSAGSPQLSRTFSVQENAAALLQQRFRRLDSAQGIPKRLEKPW